MSILNKYKYVIWDWNGTVLDDTWLCLEIINRLSKIKDLKEITIDKYREIFDFPVSDYYKKVGFKTDSETMEFLVKEFITEYYSRVYECDMNKGVLEILEKNKNQNKKQYILSASNTESLKKVVERFKINKYFEKITGLDNHLAASKSEIGKKWFEKEQIEKSKAIMIGDTKHDHEVAQKIGIDCILVSLGHQSYKRLKKYSENKNIVVYKNFENFIN